MDERMRRRLELRRSNAAAPRRNRYRESKVSPPWDQDDFRDMDVVPPDEETKGPTDG